MSGNKKETDRNSMKDLQKRHMLCVFLIAFLPRLLFALIAPTMRVTSDELSTLAVAAHFAGYDWTESTSIAGYYGTGFSFVYTPILMLVENPILSYRIILIIQSMLVAAIAPLSYYLMDKIFDVQDKIYVCIVSVGCSYLMALPTVYLYNEHIYVFLSWLLVLFLLLLNQYRDNTKKKILYTICLLLVLGYSLTIHTRAIAYWVMVLVTIVIYRWVYKKSLVYVKVFLPGMLLMYWAGKTVASVSLNSIWRFTDSIRNTEVTLPGIALLVKDIRSWLAWFYIIIGELNTGTIFTGGALILFGIIGGCFIITRLFKKNDTDAQEKEAPYLIVFVLSLVGILGTILTQSISTWLPDVYNAIVKGSAQADGWRAVTYLRYYFPVVGALSMAGMAYLHQYKDKLKTYLISSGIVILALQILWVFLILPYIYNNAGTLMYYEPFSVQRYISDTIGIMSYLPATVITILLCLVFGICIVKGKLKVVAVCTSVLYIYMFGYISVSTIWKEQNHVTYVDDSYQLVKQLEDKEVELPETIYVQNTWTSQSSQSVVCLYQFWLKEYKISRKEPTEENSDVVLFFTSQEADRTDLLQNGFLCGQVGDREYVYVKGKSLQRAVESCGVVLGDSMDYEKQVRMDTLTANENYERTKKSIISNGQEGYLVDGMNIDFSGGRLAVDVVLQVQESEERYAGTIELTANGRNQVIYSDKIDTKTADETGKIVWSFSEVLEKIQDLQLNIQAANGSVISLQEIQISRTAEEYVWGEEYLENVEKIQEIMEYLAPNVKVVYATADLSEYAQDTLLAETWGANREFQVVHDTESLQEQEGDYFLIYSGQIEGMPEELERNFVKVYETAEYHLYIPKESGLIHYITLHNMQQIKELG